MTLSLDSRRALVTGGASGIGLAGPTAGFVSGASLSMDGGWTAR